MISKKVQGQLCNIQVFCNAKVCNRAQKNKHKSSEGVSLHHTHRELTLNVSRWAHFEDTQLPHSELTRRLTL